MFTRGEPTVDEVNLSKLVEFRSRMKDEALAQGVPVADNDLARMAKHAERLGVALPAPVD